MSCPKTWLIQSMSGGVERKLLVRETGSAATRSGVRRNRSMSARRKRYSDCFGSPTKKSWPGRGARRRPPRAARRWRGRCRAGGDRCPGTRRAGAPGSAAPARSGPAGRGPDRGRPPAQHQRSWNVSRPDRRRGLGLVKREASQLVASRARIGSTSRSRTDARRCPRCLWPTSPLRVSRAALGEPYDRAAPGAAQPAGVGSAPCCTSSSRSSSSQPAPRPRRAHEPAGQPAWSRRPGCRRGRRRGSPPAGHGRRSTGASVEWRRLGGRARPTSGRGPSCRRSARPRRAGAPG